MKQMVKYMNGQIMSRMSRKKQTINAKNAIILIKKGNKKMGEIALTNTINVSLSGTPSGLGEFSTNTILLASNETPLNAEPYIWAVNAQDIINAYGSNSET